MIDLSFEKKIEGIKFTKHIAILKKKTNSVTEECEHRLLPLFSLNKKSTSFFGLLIGNDTMILCWESVIFRCFCFVPKIPTFRHGLSPLFSNVRLFNLLLLKLKLSGQES